MSKVSSANSVSSNSPKMRKRWWSRLLDHLVRWWRQRAVLAEQRDLAVAVEKQPEAWNRSKAALLRIQELCKQQDVAFVVAVFPMLSELEAAPYRRLHEMAASFCEESGIRTVDLKSGFDGLNELDLWVHPTDQHPNHTGHQILAEGILDYLKAEGLLP